MWNTGKQKGHEDDVSAGIEQGIDQGVNIGLNQTGFNVLHAKLSISACLAKLLANLFSHFLHN